MIEFHKLKELIKLNPLEMLVSSDSMDPYLKKADKIIVKHIPFDKIKTYDIIVFKKNQKLICHYVKNINDLQVHNNAMITTQGVKSVFEDLPVFENEVVGIVISHRLPNSFRIKQNLILIFRKLLGKFGFNL